MSSVAHLMRAVAGSAWLWLAQVVRGADDELCGGGGGGARNTRYIYLRSRSDHHQSTVDHLIITQQYS